jgi:hypothetical protein
MVAHTYNLSYLGGKDGRTEAQEKLARLHLKNMSGVVLHTCNSSYLGGRGRRIKV